MVSRAPAARRTAVVGFAAMGAAALVRPTVVGRTMGLRIVNDSGRAEVRGVYGGFGLAVAVALASDSSGATSRTAGVALVGMALGRASDTALSGRFPTASTVALVGETLLGSWLILDARQGCGSARREYGTPSLRRGVLVASPG